MVTRYIFADLVLVQVKSNKTFEIIPNLEVFNSLKERGIEIQVPVKYNITSLDDLLAMVSNMHWEQQGVVLKYNGFRSKMRNEKFNYVKSIRGNNPKILYTYLELRNNKMVKEYLQYFPEYTPMFNAFKGEVEYKTKELHRNYMEYRVKNAISIQEVPIELRPLIYELHGVFLARLSEYNAQEDKENLTRPRITFMDCITFINSLPIKRLIFVLNYQKNAEYHQSKMVMEEEEAETGVEVATPILEEAVSA
jgi:hypothetical protein